MIKSTYCFVRQIMFLAPSELSALDIWSPSNGFRFFICRLISIRSAGCTLGIFSSRHISIRSIGCTLGIFWYDRDSFIITRWMKLLHPFADTFLLGLRAALWAFHNVDSGRFWDDRDSFIITRWTKSFHPFAGTFLLGLRAALWAFHKVDSGRFLG